MDKVYAVGFKEWVEIRVSKKSIKTVTREHGKKDLKEVVVAYNVTSKKKEDGVWEHSIAPVSEKKDLGNKIKTVIHIGGKVLFPINHSLFSNTIGKAVSRGKAIKLNALDLNKLSKKYPILSQYIDINELTELREKAGKQASSWKYEPITFTAGTTTITNDF